MATKVEYAAKVTVLETLSTAVPGAADPTLTQAGYNTEGSFSSTSTPPTTKSVVNTVALVAGAKTIDLTALTGINGATVDFTGLKVQFVKCRNPSANTGAITVQAGAANAYNLLGASWKVILQTGDEFTWKGSDDSGVPDVASGVKNIDLAGTGTESLEVVLVAG